MTNPEPIEAGPGVLSAEERDRFDDLREAWRRAAFAYTDAAAGDVEWLSTLIDRQDAEIRRLLPLVVEQEDVNNLRRPLDWLNEHPWHTDECLSWLGDGCTCGFNLARDRIDALWAKWAAGAAAPGEPTGDAETSPWVDDGMQVLCRTCGGIWPDHDEDCAGEPTGDEEP